MYYFNLSRGAYSSIGSPSYREFSSFPSGGGETFSISDSIPAGGTSTILTFATNTGDPNTSIIAGGIWNFQYNLGATSSFYKGPNAKSFRQMFLEAAKESNLIIDNLEKDLCYSFVLQHPENRIVIPFNKPGLFIVAIFKIKNEDNAIIVEKFDIEQIKEQFNTLNFKVQFPKKYSFYKYSDLIEQFASMNTSYDIVGVVLNNTITGERSKIRQ
jgi:hypothetical protein